jgi:hypothetical protein
MNLKEKKNFSTNARKNNLNLLYCGCRGTASVPAVTQQLSNFRLGGGGGGKNKPPEGLQ